MKDYLKIPFTFKWEICKDTLGVWFKDRVCGCMPTLRKTKFDISVFLLRLGLVSWHKTQQYQWGLSLGSSWQRLDEGLCAGSLFGGQWPQRSGVRHGKGKIRKKKNKTNTDWLPLSSARPWPYQDFLRHLMKDGSKLCAQEREGWSICPLLALPNDEVLPRVALSPLQF